MKTPNYAIIKELPTHILIEDLGPWSQYPTITNAAEETVESLAPRLNGRRLFYIDSEGQTDELKVINGKFAGFAPGYPF